MHSAAHNPNKSALQYILGLLTACRTNVSTEQICKSFAILTVRLTDIQELKISHWWPRVIKFGLRTGHEDPEGKQMCSSILSLNLAMDRDWVVMGTTWAALAPGKVLGTHCSGGLVGPWAGLDGGRISCPNQNYIPGPSNP
jgi:hypothetical protein